MSPNPHSLFRQLTLFLLFLNSKRHSKPSKTLQQTASQHRNYLCDGEEFCCHGTAAAPLLAPSPGSSRGTSPLSTRAGAQDPWPGRVLPGSLGAAPPRGASSLSLQVSAHWSSPAPLQLPLSDNKSPAAFVPGKKHFSPFPWGVRGP